MTVQRGKVKFFNELKGFGFITPHEGKKDIFVHKTNVDVEGGIQKNDEVQFDVVESPKGTAAANVRLVL